MILKQTNIRSKKRFLVITRNFDIQKWCRMKPTKWDNFRGPNESNRLEVYNNDRISTTTTTTSHTTEYSPDQINFYKERFESGQHIEFTDGKKIETLESFLCTNKIPQNEWITNGDDKTAFYKLAMDWLKDHNPQTGDRMIFELSNRLTNKLNTPKYYSPESFSSSQNDYMDNIIYYTYKFIDPNNLDINVQLMNDISEHISNVLPSTSIHVYNNLIGLSGFCHQMVLASYSSKVVILIGVATYTAHFGHMFIDNNFVNHLTSVRDKISNKMTIEWYKIGFKMVGSYNTGLILSSTVNIILISVMALNPPKPTNTPDLGLIIAQKGVDQFKSDSATFAARPEFKNHLDTFLGDVMINRLFLSTNFIKDCAYAVWLGATQGTITLASNVIEEASKIINKK